MLPPSDRRRDPLEYEGHDIRPSIDRSYARVADAKLESPSHPKPSKSPPHSTIEAKLKDITDPGRESLNGARTRAPSDVISEKTTSYGYPTPERYRDAGEYGARPPYAAFERGRDQDPREPPFDKRDPRDPYYSSPNYPAVAPSDYRIRDAYPPRAQPPLDYARGTAYDERYPRGALDLDPPRGRGEYRDLPPRPLDYDIGAKRKFDDPEYRDPYLDEYRVIPLKDRLT
jgi:hypothetical protein